MTELQVHDRVDTRSEERRAGQGSTQPERVTVIKPAPRWPHLDLVELWHFRELLGRLAWRDVAVRYKQTSIGVTWAILQPFLTMVVFTFIFGRFANFPQYSWRFSFFWWLSPVLP